MERFESTAFQGPGVRGRYAPSPTGPQHFGNARTALLAWLQARLAGGAFVLRMEDLDLPRVRSGSAEGIPEELEWLGLDWDEGGEVGGPCSPYAQSARNGLYESALRALEERGMVFNCTCSRKDIRMASSAPHGSAPVYPGTCREAGREMTQRPCSRRFRVPDGTVSFDDQVIGTFTQDVQVDVGDFILRRGDGLFAYQLAVVVDDALMGISDVVRGMDLIDSTPRQILLYEALDVPTPRFWHVPLMRTESGDRMSKRFGSMTLQAYRADGGDAPGLVGRLAASVGLARPGRRVTPGELLAMHDIDSFRQCLRQASGRDGGTG